MITPIAEGGFCNTILRQTTRMWCGPRRRRLVVARRVERAPVGPEQDEPDQRYALVDDDAQVDPRKELTVRFAVAVDRGIHGQKRGAVIQAFAGERFELQAGYGGKH